MFWISIERVEWRRWWKYPTSVEYAANIWSHDTCINQFSRKYAIKTYTTICVHTVRTRSKCTLQCYTCIETHSYIMYDLVTCVIIYILNTSIAATHQVPNFLHRPSFFIVFLENKSGEAGRQGRPLIQNHRGKIYVQNGNLINKWLIGT